MREYYEKILLAFICTLPLSAASLEMQENHKYPETNTTNLSRQVQDLYTPMAEQLSALRASQTLINDNVSDANKHL